MNNQLTQKTELAGKTKLTAVTIGHGHDRSQFFAMLLHDSQGRAILPSQLLNQHLIRVRRGGTFTVG